MVFCNSRFHLEKGVIYLVEAFADVLKSFGRAELWLCGGDFPFSSTIAGLTLLTEVEETIESLAL